AGGVWLCTAVECGQFYHVDCVAACPTAVLISPGTDQGAGAGASSAAGAAVPAPAAAAGVVASGGAGGDASGEGGATTGAGVASTVEDANTAMEVMAPAASASAAVGTGTVCAIVSVVGAGGGGGIAAPDAGTDKPDDQMEVDTEDTEHTASEVSSDDAAPATSAAAPAGGDAGSETASEGESVGAADDAARTDVAAASGEDAAGATAVASGGGATARGGAAGAAAAAAAGGPNCAVATAAATAGKAGGGAKPATLKLASFKPTVLEDLDAGRPVFRCGYHACLTCEKTSGGARVAGCPLQHLQRRGASGGGGFFSGGAHHGKGCRKTGHLFRCFKCPTSFHLDCMPPAVRHHPFAVLCPNHPRQPLPTLRDEDQLAALGLDIGLVATAAGLPALQLPRAAPKAKDVDDPRHFRLPNTFLDAVYSKPPPFNHVQSLQWTVPRPPRREASEMCNCTTACDEHCINRLLHVECVGGEPAVSGDGKGGGRFRGMCFDNCKVGPGCGNRRIQNRDAVKVAAFREGGRGWGLRTAAPAQKGALISEYVGEVINQEEVDRRLELQQDERPDDHDFYIMELENGLFVDAAVKGNLSRLINHSCDPNCELSRWDTAGFTRIGIFAARDLAEGEPLSYDYQFDTADADRFQCRCGAANCRGTMAPRRAHDNSGGRRRRGDGGGGDGGYGGAGSKCCKGNRKGAGGGSGG
ncbi:unnamed protein product, partial [Phaeothamnion confervicola]